MTLSELIRIILILLTGLQGIEMKCLLVDDHALFRGGLAQILRQLDDSIDIIEVSNVDELLDRIKEHNDLDIVLLDLSMPGKNGFDAMQLLANSAQSVPIVIISASEKMEDIRRSKQLGARGFIGKYQNSELVISALRVVLSGEFYFPSQAQETFTSPETDLTVRQKEVLRLMDEGMSNKSIANTLKITEATVKMHVTAIFREMGVSNRTQAVIKAKELGIN